MNKQVSVLGNLRIAGAAVVDQDVVDFPSSAKLGTLLLKGGSLFAYTSINGIATWYPLFQNHSNAYLHTQITPNLTWVVNHQLGSQFCWYQIKDESGNILFESSATNDENGNTTTLTFAEPVSGTAIFIGPNDVALSNINASLIEVGAVKITTTGIYVNGQLVTSGGVSKASELINDIGFITSLEAPVQSVAGRTGAVVLSVSDIANAVSTTQIGVVNGIASLDSSGKVPAGQLPSYVDDVLEYSNLAGFPVSGEGGKIYVDTTTNKVYRWSGSTYVEVSPAGSVYFADILNKPTSLAGYNITDAYTKTAIDGFINSNPKKQSVYLATSANYNVFGGDTTPVDGVYVTSGSGKRILLLGQTNPVENGIWVENSGAWIRPVDFQTGTAHTGDLIYVDQGTFAGQTFVLSTTGTITVGYININNSQMTAGSSLTFLNSSYVLPTASTSVLGGVKVDGSTITINNGVISAAASNNQSGETVNVLGNISGAKTIDVSLGTYVTGTITGATTLSLTNVPDSTHAYAVTLELTNAGTNITWPATVTWLGTGTVPTLKASGVNMVTLVTRNGGASWLGNAA